jgi:hypothetical protein
MTPRRRDHCVRPDKGLALLRRWFSRVDADILQKPIDELKAKSLSLTKTLAALEFQQGKKCLLAEATDESVNEILAQSTA